MSLLVWRPRKSLIPAILGDAARKFKYKHNIDFNLKNPYARTLRHGGGGVELYTLRGVDCIYCDGICPWHNDRHVDEQYSLLLVLRNDIGSWVESKGVEVNKEQSVGTLIFLDIWEQHRLWKEEGMKSKYGNYLAVTINLEKPLKLKKDYESLMHKYIERVR